MRVKFYETNEVNPHKNLALEKYFLNHLKEDDFIIYFWANKDTIVIGRNQYVYDQVNMNEIEKDKITIARRLSGGGAVYHDENNVNFSFIFDIRHHNKEIGYFIILEALKKIGIQAEKNGRNDITVNNSKFSGNAFLGVGNSYCHHGTILINTDVEKMSRYLNVPNEKLSNKGVSSVRSRVVNLIEVKNDINRKEIIDSTRLISNSIFNQELHIIKPNEIDFDEVEKGRLYFADKRFLFGEELKECKTLNYRIEDVGLVSVYYKVLNGVIVFSKIFTDSLQLYNMPELNKKLLNKKENEIFTVLTSYFNKKRKQTIN